MQIKENISLQPFNSFGIEVYAKYFASFNSIDQLQELIASTQHKKNTHLILGGGSNILFTKNIEALVMKNEIEGVEVIEEQDDFILVQVGAGMNWHQFVVYCIHHGYAGIENLALIPGSIGASPMQNIGAYGVEIKDVFHSLEAIDIHDGNTKIFTNSECEFGYRESIFKNKYKDQFVITSVTYRLSKKPVFNTTYGAIQQEIDEMGIKDLSIKAIAQAVMNIRNSKLPDPLKIGNAGSFFKNPEIETGEFEKLKVAFPSLVGYPTKKDIIKIPAGWLIEQAGWKGFREGDAGCYDKQALVLVNYGKATGLQILDLSERIIKSVQSTFGILLQREVNVY